MFQSLFWWKYCPGEKRKKALHPVRVVSILVLVEVLPWARQDILLKLIGF